MECGGGCYWSGDKLFIEVPLPTLVGNVTGASLHLDVTGGSGDAWLNVNSIGGLTGDVNGDQPSMPFQFNNGGIRIAGATPGWINLDVTSGVQTLYTDDRAYGMFSLDPVLWSTSLALNGLNTYLTITTDSDLDNSQTPEPATLLFAITGIACMAGLRRFRKS